MARVDKVRVVLSSEPIAIVGGKKLRRVNVPGGWICYPESNHTAMFFVRDENHVWSPPVVERGGPERISSSKTNLEHELALVKLLDAGMGRLGGWVRNDDVYREMLADGIRAVLNDTPGEFRDKWACEQPEESK